MGNKRVRAQGHRLLFSVERHLNDEEDMLQFKQRVYNSELRHISRPAVYDLVGIIVK